MNNEMELERFVKAQHDTYETAFSEIRQGCKRTHWIWYIFPQLVGLGHSSNARYYGIRNRAEAEAYLNHPVLGSRLRRISERLLTVEGRTAREILGNLDAMKVRSSMTLFDAVSPNDIFGLVLDKFYGGQRCQYTLEMLDEKPDIQEALRYIGADSSDFVLYNPMFSRRVHAPIHGIGHIYRTMIACALLGKALEKPREGLLAFCGAYIHDLARRTDGAEPEHGPNAAKYFFGRFQRLWDKYGLTPEECEQVRQAVSQHSTRELLRPSDAGYAVMAILKDADALDRCRRVEPRLAPLSGEPAADWLHGANLRKDADCESRTSLRGFRLYVPFGYIGIVTKSDIKVHQDVDTKRIFV